MLGKIQAEGISQGVASEIQLDDSEEDPCFCGRSCCGKQAPTVREKRKKKKKQPNKNTCLLFGLKFAFCKLRKLSFGWSHFCSIQIFSAPVGNHFLVAFPTGRVTWQVKMLACHRVWQLEPNCWDLPAPLLPKRCGMSVLTYIHTCTSK